MKKPAKPKPKRRAKKAAPTPPARRGDAPRAGAAAATAPKPKPKRKQPATILAPGALQPVLKTIGAAERAQARAIAELGYSSEDRQALALLLLPLLILAASLGMSQTWKYALPGLTEIASHAPIERGAGLRPLPPVVTVTPSGPLDYPTAAPQIDIAIVPDVAVPTVALAYPAAVPEIAVADVLTRALAYPSVAPLTAVEVAVWSPARPGWLDDRTAPPAPVAAAPWPAPLPSADELCTPTPARLAAFSASGRFSRMPRVPPADASDQSAFGLKLASAARAQAGDLVVYSARYHPMAYPMGDMPTFYGACTDVVIRAYRALGIDLQELVQRSRSGRGDPNIDHRRTETLRTFFIRQGSSLAVTSFPEDYKPGDIVTYHRPFSRVSNSHIAIVSDVLAPTGRPMIVHNRGWGPQLEDALFVDRITGHYRYSGKAPESAAAAEIAGVRQRSPRDVLQATYAGPALAQRRVLRAPEATPATGVSHASRTPKAVTAPH